MGKKKLKISFNKFYFPSILAKPSNRFLQYTLMDMLEYLSLLMCNSSNLLSMMMYVGFP